MARKIRASQRALWKISIALIILVTIITMIVFLSVKFAVEPNLEGISKMRAEALISKTVSETLAEQFVDQRNQTNEELFTIKKDKDGAMEMVQANSVEINILMSELSVGLHEAFHKVERETFNVPVGALLGSEFLSQMGPQIDVTVMPMGVSHMDFRTEFESKGINQTKYKIYIELECRVKVLAPFSSKVFGVNNTVLIAEAVILGDVPNSYVQVPKEDILDVTDE